MFTVKISYEDSEVHARLTSTLDFPHNLETVETALSTPDVMICSSSSQIFLLDHSLSIIRIFDREFDVVSMCLKGDKIAFLQEDKVWAESIEMHRMKSIMLTM